MQFRTSAAARDATPPPAVNGLAPTVSDDAIAVRVELGVPLSGTRGAIGTIEIREPSFGDYLDCGPLTRNIAMRPSEDASDMRVEVVEDHNALMRWMVRLTGQPEAVLRQMRPRDAFAVRREIARIVAEFDLGNSPSAPTNSSSSSA
jgi:hypothetical protein